MMPSHFELASQADVELVPWIDNPFATVMFHAGVRRAISGSLRCTMAGGEGIPTLDLMPVLHLSLVVEVEAIGLAL